MNKQEIINTINTKIAGKIRNFETLIAETRASNNDTKSSMGDKYETGREMLQQEINNLQRQLNETLNQQAVLQKITSDPSEKVQNGALVKTDKGLFYIAASIGEITVENQKVMTVSAESPLVKAMFGKKMGDVFAINTMNQVIENIW
ncbi:GreA/GreB family elongation factor [Chryseobacterium sp. WG14]|uniref:GreA/GreB family elongation factor n=1 Tax=unclassified Chryseobacterium TaxID=2593645 RepID=UPI001D2BB0BE|nr:MULTISPECIES: GreA/GreB family elongation factor [unclassified Chryseobacterium]MCQ9635860.1 GreA/GreB family elongation factor [Chryseobacterium sp. WG23]MCQ9637764.1 GreA/GreB family elongation factor [Chryseobacterium sp. WG14]CAH0217441.1 Transcription elongation factor GreB [Chryseobacterium sp. Bi04]